MSACLGLTYVFAKGKSEFRIPDQRTEPDSKLVPPVTNLPTNTDNNDSTPNSVWMRSCQMRLVLIFKSNQEIY